jgi:hypothetical protein
MRLTLVVVLLASCLEAKEFRADCAGGGDFKTLEEVNAAQLAPGDSVRLKAGCRWTGQLSARAGVTYGRYGNGARPRIDAEGKHEDAILIRSSGDTLLISPPLIIDEEQIEEIFAAIRRALITIS